HYFRYLSYLMIAAQVAACADSLSDSLEGRDCSASGACLAGFQCSADNICVRISRLPRAPSQVTSVEAANADGATKLDIPVSSTDTGAPGEANEQAIPDPDGGAASAGADAQTAGSSRAMSTPGAGSAGGPSAG